MKKFIETVFDVEAVNRGQDSFHIFNEISFRADVILHMLPYLCCECGITVSQVKYRIDMYYFG